MPSIPQGAAPGDEDDPLWTADEREIVEHLRNEHGGSHRVLPGGFTENGRRYDATVDDERAEFKTPDPGANSATLRNRAAHAARKGGQARFLIFDLRKCGMSRDEALRGIARIRGAYARYYDRIRVVGDGYDFMEEF